LNGMLIRLGLLAVIVATCLLPNGLSLHPFRPPSAACRIGCRSRR
jgi:hypothetical protein